MAFSRQELPLSSCTASMCQILIYPDHWYHDAACTGTIIRNLHAGYSLRICQLPIISSLICHAEPSCSCCSSNSTLCGRSQVPTWLENPPVSGSRHKCFTLPGALKVKHSYEEHVFCFSQWFALHGQGRAATWTEHRQGSHWPAQFSTSCE